MALIKCSSCGHMISDKAEKCPKCGYSVDEIGTSQEETFDEEQPKKKWWIWALVIALLCLIGGGAYFGFTNEPQEETKEPVIEEKKDSVEMEAEVEVKEDIVELTPDFINAIKKYDGIEEFSDGYAAVSKGHKWGYINTKGDVAIPVTIDADYVGKFSEGLAIVIPFSSGEYYVIDSKGKTVFKGNGYDGTWDAHIPYYINGKMYVQEGGKYQIYDRQGKKTGIVDIEVGNNIYKNHEIGEYSFFSKTHDDRYDGIGAYDETYGLKDISGRVIIAPEYDMIQGQGNSSTKISNGVVLVALTEYDESYDGGEDEHTIYHYGYADLKGNDTFTAEQKRRWIESKKTAKAELVKQESQTNNNSGMEEVSSYNEDLSWIQGNWRCSVDVFGAYKDYRVGIAEEYISVFMDGEHFYTGPYTVSGNMIHFKGTYLIIDFDRKVIMADKSTTMYRF